MKLLKRLLNFYINSSIHVALAVYALSYITLLEFNIDYDEAILYFIFYATVTGYNFVKYFGTARFHHRSLASWLKVIQIFSLLAFLGMCYYALKIESQTLLVSCILAVITFFYAVPVIPKRFFIDDKKNLRQIGGLKVYVIAIVWAVAVVIIPALNNLIPIETDVIITTVQRFLFVIVLMLPFEIRDLNYDSLKLATIPQKIGIKKTKLIGVLILMVFFVLEYFKDDLNETSLMATLIVTFITLLFLVFSNKNQSKYYSAFWVESIPILWLLILLMLR